MKRMSAFEIWLRTGRRVAEDPQPAEVKFNPWHDPDDGRFTFAGQGRYFGGGGAGSGGGGSSAAASVRSSAQSGGARLAAGGTPTRRASNPKPKPAPVRKPPPRAIHPLVTRPAKQVLSEVGPNAPSRRLSSAATRKPGPGQDSATYVRNPKEAIDRIRRETEAAPSPIRPIRDYPETGATAWRASNDRVFVAAATKFNRGRGLKPGDPKYIDPLFIKAWAMVESGGSKSAFHRDPLQVNNPGDWANEKTKFAGLAKGQRMTPELSVEAALKWLEYKGSLHGPWEGYRTALENYNGNKKIYPHTEGLPHRKWYAQQVIKLYRASR